MSKFDTVCALSFTFLHDIKKPNDIRNVDKIKDAILDKVRDMTDEEIIYQIDFGETVYNT
tara:strand:+ start:3599 stop:3778 length:180 start_codon:yes stop_codon:yes gene_type:complete